MPIPDDVMKEANALHHPYAACEHNDVDQITAIAQALLAAEIRGMERAAEIIASQPEKYKSIRYASRLAYEYGAAAITAEIEKMRAGQ